MTTTEMAINLGLMVAVSLFATAVMVTVPNLHSLRVWIRRTSRVALPRSVRPTRATTSGQVLRAGRP
jgi:hypothetical protein